MKGHLLCPACGTLYPQKEAAWQCSCGSYLDLAYTFTPRPEDFSGPQGFLRYCSVLPLEHPDKAFTFNEGFTPLHLTELLGQKVLVKMDFLLTTGSFKDRGAFVLINKCRELGIRHFVEDSSGNAASSMAAYAAPVGLEAHIYMQAGISSAKTMQASAYGARLYKIPGSREDCARAAEEAAKSSYYAAHTRNPYFLHGTKTVIYEMMEQLGWEVPSALFIPVGCGSQLLGIWLGLQEMKRAGLIDRYPRLMAIQSEHCSPLKDHLEGRDTPHLPKDPILAEGIAIRRPPRLKQILQAVQETGGRTLVVPDNHIMEALKAAAAKGLYIEPTSAAAVAALKQYKAPNVRLSVVVLTGHGLKSKV
ncbi:MAG: pyridoxal-phosphate dependent enzyme [Bacteroidales bacterium]|nr:pyridoxal-phosphate dependent enzyme [Bacteroidales bacterium]